VGPNMDNLKISEDLRPLSDLKSKASEIVRQANENGRPVVLTRHGRGVAVVLSLELFEEMQADARRTELQRAVEDAERDLEAGHHVSHTEVESKLKRWTRGEA
jgi:antitoxin YefM